jgi:ribosomal protein L34E
MELGSMEPQESGQEKSHYMQGKPKTIRCFYCQRTAHGIADCRQRKIDERKKQRTQPFKPPAQQSRQPQFQNKGDKPTSRRSTI